MARVEGKTAFMVSSVFGSGLTRRQRSLAFAAKVIVSLFAAFNLLWTPFEAGLFQAAPVNWSYFAIAILGFASMGLTPWLIYPAISIGAASLILSLVTIGGTGVEPFVIIPCLVGMAVKSPWWPLWTLTAFDVVWAVGISFVLQSKVTGWTYGLVILLSLVVGLALRYLTVERVNTKTRLATTERELIDAAREKRQALIDERQRLGRELHDGVSHELAIISNQAMAYGRNQDIEKVRKALLRSGEASRSALDELRAALGMLRDQSEVDEFYDPSEVLAIRVEDTVVEVESSLREQGFNPLMRVDVTSYVFPPVLQTTISRVLREGSTNIIRYAQPATSCTFVVIVNPGEVVMMVSSTLRPEPPDGRVGQSTGLGLVGLGERLRLVHGQFSAGPENNLWVIRALVPRT